MDKVVVLIKAMTKEEKTERTNILKGTIVPDGTHKVFNDPDGGDIAELPDHKDPSQPKSNESRESRIPAEIRHRYIPEEHHAMLRDVISGAWKDGDPALRAAPTTSFLPAVKDGKFIGNSVGIIAKERLQKIAANEEESPERREMAQTLCNKHFGEVNENHDFDTDKIHPNLLNNGTLQRRFLRVGYDAPNPVLTKHTLTHDPSTGEKRSPEEIARLKKEGASGYAFQSRSQRYGDNAGDESKDMAAIKTEEVGGIKAHDWAFQPEHSYHVRDADGNDLQFQHDDLFDDIANKDEHGNSVAGIDVKKAKYMAHLGWAFRRWYRDFSQDLGAQIKAFRNPNASEEVQNAPDDKKQEARERVRLAAKSEVMRQLRAFGYAGNRTPVDMNFGIFPKILARFAHKLLDNEDDAKAMRGAGLLGGVSKVDLAIPMQAAVAAGKALASGNRKLREYTNSFMTWMEGDKVDPKTGRRLDKTRFGAAVDEWMRRIFSGMGKATKAREQDHIQGQMNNLSDDLTREGVAANKPDNEWEGNPLQASMWVGNKIHIKNKAKHLEGKLNGELGNLNSGRPLFNTELDERLKGLQGDDRKALKEEYRQKLLKSISSVQNYARKTTGGASSEDIFDQFGRWQALHDNTSTNDKGAVVPDNSHFTNPAESRVFSEYNPDSLDLDGMTPQEQKVAIDSQSESFMPRNLKDHEKRVPLVLDQNDEPAHEQPENVGMAKVVPTADYSVYKHIGAIKDELATIARSGLMAHSFPKIFDLHLHPELAKGKSDEEVANILADSVGEYTRLKIKQGDKARFAEALEPSGGGEPIMTPPSASEDGDDVENDDSDALSEGNSDAGADNKKDDEEYSPSDGLHHNLHIIHTLAKGELPVSDEEPRYNKKGKLLPPKNPALVNGINYGSDYNKSAMTNHHIVAPQRVLEDMAKNGTDYLRAGKYRRDENGNTIKDGDGNPIFEEMPTGGVTNRAALDPSKGQKRDENAAIRIGKKVSYLDAVTLPEGEEPLRDAIMDSEGKPTKLGEHLVHIHRHNQVASETGKMATAKRDAFQGIKNGFEDLKSAIDIPDAGAKATAIVEAKSSIAKAVKARNKVLKWEERYGFANPLSTYATEASARSLNWLAALANELVGDHASLPHGNIKLDHSLPYENHTGDFKDVNPFEPTRFTHSVEPEGSVNTYAANRFASKGIGEREDDYTLSSSDLFGRRQRRALHVVGIIVKAQPAEEEEGEGSQAEDILSATKQISQHPNCRCYLERQGAGFRWVLQDTACHDCIRKAMEFNSRNYPDPVIQDDDNQSPQPAMRQGWSDMNRQQTAQAEPEEDEQETEAQEPQPTPSLRGGWGREMGGGKTYVVATTPPKAPDPNAASQQSYRQRRGRGR